MGRANAENAKLKPRRFGEYERVIRTAADPSLTLLALPSAADFFFMILNIPSQRKFLRRVLGYQDRKASVDPSK